LQGLQAVQAGEAVLGVDEGEIILQHALEVGVGEGGLARRGQVDLVQVARHRSRDIEGDLVPAGHIAQVRIAPRHDRQGALRLGQLLLQGGDLGLKFFGGEIVGHTGNYRPIAEEGNWQRII
jgi:hypothetical protein